MGVLIALAGYAALQYFVSAGHLEKRLSAVVAASTDSLYRVEIGNVDFSLLQRSFAARSLALAPDSLVLARRQQAGGLPPVRYTVTASSVRVAGVSFWALLWGGGISLEALEIQQPHVHLVVGMPDSADATRSDSGSTVPSFHRYIARQLPDMTIREVRLDSAGVSWETGQGEKKKQGDIEPFFVVLDHVAIDSLAAGEAGRFLFSEDVQIRMDGYRRFSSDSLYVLEAGSIRGSSKEAALIVDSLRWEPTVSDAAFRQRQAYRTDRYKTGFRKLTLQGVDYRGLLEQGRVFVASATVEAPQVDVYYDRTLPPKPVSGPATLPHQAFQSLGRPVRIDTIRMQHGSIRYSERAEDGVRPGTIRFENVWSSIYNVTNDSSRMTASTPAVIDARALLAGTGRLKAAIDYQLLAPRLNMAWRGSLGGMDARAFNEAFVDLEGLRVESGHVDSVWFDVKVEDNVASGALQVLYRDFKIEVLDKATRERGLRERIETLIANNLVLDSENLPDGDTPAKVAVLRNEKASDTPLFQFIWATLRRGLFQTLGL